MSRRSSRRNRYANWAGVWTKLSQWRDRGAFTGARSRASWTRDAWTPWCDARCSLSSARLASFYSSRVPRREFAAGTCRRAPTRDRDPCRTRRAASASGRSAVHGECAARRDRRCGRDGARLVEHRAPRRTRPYANRETDLASIARARVFRSDPVRRNGARVRRRDHLRHAPPVWAASRALCHALNAAPRCSGATQCTRTGAARVGASGARHRAARWLGTPHPESEQHPRRTA